MSRTAGEGAARAPTVAAAAGLLALGVLMLVSVAGPFYTDDGWWHLAAGEAFATHGPWLAEDPLLFTGREGGPVPHEWLFDVLLWELHEVGGFHLLRVLHAALAMFTLWLVYATARDWSGSAALAGLVTALFALLAAVRLMQLRPDLVSIPASVLGLRLLLPVLDDSPPPSARRIGGWLLLLVAWVNMHSLFLVGINLVVAGALGLLLAVLLARLRPYPQCDEPSRRHRAALGRLTLALALGLLATLLNPEGSGALLRFFTSSDESAMWRITDEWAHFNPFSHADSDDVPRLAWLLSNAVLAGFAVCAVSALLNHLLRPSPRSLELLSPVLLGLSLAAVVAMLSAVRFLWLGWLPALYAARWLALVIPGRWRGGRLALDWLAAAGVLWLALQYLFYPPFETTVARYAAEPSAWFTTPYRSHKYYAEGVYFLQRTGLEGRVFNVYWMGGFLGYWRAPRIRTFVDGRTEHYDAAVFEDYALVGGLAPLPGGGSVLDILDARGVDLFFGVGFAGSWHPVFTTPFLERAAGWLLVSRSFRHAIYLRDNPRNRENPERVRAFYAAEGVPFDITLGLDPDAVVRVRPDFAVRERMLVPRHAELLAEFESGDADHRLAAGATLSVNYLLTGAYASAVAIDRALGRSHPADAAVHWRLCWALLHLGELDEAVAIAERLVAEISADPVSQRLLAMAGRYREVLRGAEYPDPAERWAEAQRLLLRDFPASYIETWRIDDAIETEDLPLERARR